MPTWLDRILTWTRLRDPWAPGPAPNPFAVPTDPAATDRSVADPAGSDPYHDGQWSPLLAPVPTNPVADQVRADAYVPPYTGPLDLDDYGRETDEMRRAYRDLHRTEPALRSAIDGKAAAVAALDVSVLPEDKDRPEDCRAAKFVDWTVSRSPHGWDGLILTILRPALIDGFSISEKVLKGVDDSRLWGGYWGLKHVKGRDTAHLQLRLDGYRNVLGVVNTVRGLRTFAPGKFVLFTHAELFDNPFGQSDLRAAYRAAGQIKDAYQLWYLALKRCGEPYLHGKYDHPAQRAEFEKALRSLRAGGWAVTGSKDEIAVLDLAGAASFDAFERKVRLLREDIFLAVRGAYTPFMQSNSGAGEARGSAAVSQHGGSDPVEEVLARAVGRVLTDQLVPDLVRPNFGPGVGLPRVVLGGVNWGEMKARLDILERAKKLGLSVSAKWAHETLQIPPATRPGDELGAPKSGKGGGGLPGGNPASAPRTERTFGAGFGEVVTFGWEDWEQTERGTWRSPGGRYLSDEDYQRRRNASRQTGSEPGAAHPEGATDSGKLAGVGSETTRPNGPPGPEATSPSNEILTGERPTGESSDSGRPAGGQKDVRKNEPSVSDAGTLIPPAVHEFLAGTQSLAEREAAHAAVRAKLAPALKKNQTSREYQAALAARLKAHEDQEAQIEQERQRLRAFACRDREPARIQHNLSESGLTKVAQAAAQKALDFVADLVARAKPLRVGFAIAGPDGAMCRTANGRTDIELMKKSENVSTAVHELGHAVEDQDSGIEQASRAFLHRRCGDEKPTRLVTLPGGETADPKAYGRKDRFAEVFDDTEAEAYYVGRVYDQGGSEVISMGLQKLYNDPVRFMTLDPDYAGFLLEVVAGKGGGHGTG